MKLDAAVDHEPGEEQQVPAALPEGGPPDSPQARSRCLISAVWSAGRYMLTRSRSVLVAFGYVSVSVRGIARE